MSTDTSAHSYHGPHGHHHRFLFHPTAKFLIETHNQDNWSITKDGLICAPVGYYRILEKQAEDGPVYTLAFAFDAGELDLVPSKTDPTRKTLKKASYILEPINETYIRDRVELSMRRHQGDWLTYSLGFVNLYYTDRTKEDGGIYFSNNFISFGIFPEQMPNGLPGYRLSYLVYPFNRDFGPGMNQNDDSLLGQVFEHGVTLGHYFTEEAAIHKIQRVFPRRYKEFFEGIEVQHWSDGDLLHNVAMWINNQRQHVMEAPLTTGTAVSRMGELLITKLNPDAIAIAAAIEAMQAGAEHEHDTVLVDVADVEEGQTAPLYHMKDDVLEDWFADGNPQAHLFSDQFPICDLEDHKRNRAIDVISGPDHAIVMSCMVNDSHAVSARTPHGVHVHSMNNGDVHYVTFSPDDMQASALLPPHFKELFSNDGIACIMRCNAEEAENDQLIFASIPNDGEHHYRLSFETHERMKEIAAGNPHLLAALERHRPPNFDAPSAPVSATTQEKISLFRKCAEAILHYGRLFSPFYDARNPKACWLSYGSLLVGGILDSGMFGRFFETGAPWAFALAAGLMTNRLGTNALNKQHEINFKFIAHTLFSVGPVVSILGALPDTLAAIREVPEIIGRVKSISDFGDQVGKFGEIGEKILGPPGAGVIGYIQGRKTIAIADKVITHWKLQHLKT